MAKKSATEKTAKSTTKKARSTKKVAPRLLSGGNPQIPKGEGNAPVQAYIAAMPDWKRSIGIQLDTIIERMLPDVHKAVKWNSPFYGSKPGTKSGTWFLSFHCFDNYIKVAFFQGALLDPTPPVPSKQKEVRYLHVSKAEPLNEKLFATWVKQAIKLPGMQM